VWSVRQPCTQIKSDGTDGYGREVRSASAGFPVNRRGGHLAGCGPRRASWREFRCPKRPGKSQGGGKIGVDIFKVGRRWTFPACRKEGFGGLKRPTSPPIARVTAIRVGLGLRDRLSDRPARHGSESPSSVKTAGMPPCGANPKVFLTLFSKGATAWVGLHRAAMLLQLVSLRTPQAVELHQRSRLVGSDRDVHQASGV